jgi:acyl-coenzyme A thioesterase PaaI-like protein
MDFTGDAPDGCTPLETPPSVGTGRSFVSGDPLGDRIRIRYFLRNVDAAIVARLWFGPGAEGPPGHAHGGSIAAVIDECMGAAAWLSGHTVVAGRLVANFRAMLPLETPVTAVASVAAVTGRRVTTRARIEGADGKVYAEGEGLFIVVEPARFGDMATYAMDAAARLRGT